MLSIDTEKGLDLPAQPKVGKDVNDPASKLYQASRKALDGILQTMASQQALDAAACKKIVEDLWAGLNNGHDAILKLSLGFEQKVDAGAKPINICIQSLALGMHLKLDKQLLPTLGRAGLLVGFGEALSPTAGASDDSVFLEQLHHVVTKVDENLAWVETLIVERGKWRPEQVERLLTLVAIVAVFNELRQGIVVRPLTAQNLLQQMMQVAPDSLDADVLGHFIDTLGLYPCHCVVELNSGELGLVMEVAEQTPRQPTLQLLTDAHKQLLEQRAVIDLTEAPGRAILRVLPADEPILELLALHQQKLNP